MFNLFLKRSDVGSKWFEEVNKAIQRAINMKC